MLIPHTHCGGDVHETMWRSSCDVVFSHVLCIDVQLSLNEQPLQTRLQYTSMFETRPIDSMMKMRRASFIRVREANYEEMEKDD